MFSLRWSEHDAGVPGQRAGEGGQEVRVQAGEGHPSPQVHGE